jgi:alkylhydroperoxidase family enzyme
VIQPLTETETRDRLGHIQGTLVRPDQIDASGVSRMNLYRILLHNAELAGARAKFSDALVNSESLAARTRELLILRIAWVLRCEYMFVRHVLFSRRLGMNDDEILAVRDPGSFAGYTPVDLAVMKIADDLATGPRVTKPVWDVIASAFSPKQQVELLMAAGHWFMMGWTMNTAEIELDEGLEGWPEGRAPAP